MVESLVTQQPPDVSHNGVRTGFRRKRLMLAALVTLVGLFSGGAGYVIGQNQPQKLSVWPFEEGASVSDCGIKPPVHRPSQITLTCADGGVWLHNLQWRHWGDDLALAIGTSTENDCTPTCADGKDVEHPVNVVLFGAVDNGLAHQFTRATVTYEDDHLTSDGKASTTYELQPYAAQR